MDWRCCEWNGMNAAWRQFCRYCDHEFCKKCNPNRTGEDEDEDERQ